MPFCQLSIPRPNLRRSGSGSSPAEEPTGFAVARVAREQVRGSGSERQSGWREMGRFDQHACVSDVEGGIGRWVRCPDFHGEFEKGLGVGPVENERELRWYRGTRGTGRRI